MEIKCPKCYSSNIKKIIYGYPSDESYILAKKGEIILGGVAKEENSPQYSCEACKTDFIEGLKYDENSTYIISKINFYYGIFCEIGRASCRERV